MSSNRKTSFDFTYFGVRYGGRLSGLARKRYEELLERQRNIDAMALQYTVGNAFLVGLALSFAEAAGFTSQATDAKRFEAACSFMETEHQMNRSLLLECAIHAAWMES